MPEFKVPTTPFRFWCQKVLPLVYDDSLSYYELLCKVVEYLNNTMHDVVVLEEFVTNYFDNLDVTEQINNKLDQMAEDGTLTSLISEYVDPKITEFANMVEDFSTQTTSELQSIADDLSLEFQTVTTELEEDFTTLDETISLKVDVQDNKIDATVEAIETLTGRMDEFTNLPEGSTTGDAELADIRVAFDGRTYATAGNAVRAQAKELYDDISDDLSMLMYDYENQFPTLLFVLGDYNTYTGVPRYNNTYRACSKAPITAKRTMVLWPDSGFRYYLQFVEEGVLQSGGWHTSADDNYHGVLQIEAGQQFCITVARVTEDTSETIDINEFLSKIKIWYPVNIMQNVGIMENSYCNKETGVVEWNGTSNYQVSDFIEIPWELDLAPWIGCLCVTANPNARFAFYDANKQFISGKHGASQIIYYDPMPSNAKYVRVSTNILSKAWSDCVFQILAKRPATITHEVGKLTEPKRSYDEPAIISVNHRGYSTAPENTLPGFAESGKHGFTMIECDVRKTSDGVFVLLHDTTINRTARNSDGSAISSTTAIASITYAQALTYDFGIYKGSEYAGTTIPTLEEALTFCARANLGMFIEIESSAITNTADIKAILNLVDKCGMRDKVIFSCFYVPQLMMITGYDKEFSVAVNINEPYTTDTLPVSKYKEMLTGYNDVILMINKTKLTNEIAEYCRANNLKVGTWVVDDITQAMGYNTYVNYYLSNTLNVQEELITAMLNIV